MNRQQMFSQALDPSNVWDFLIVGGGATGVGIAVDAASRGYKALLLEAHDFGKGTSSRSTKLVHGGVRYLQQGNVSLVLEALKERGLLRENAPHLVRELRFVVPNYEWWEAPFYGIGMKVYDVLAGRYKFAKSRHLSKQETIREIPTIERTGLRGGIEYHDGQFDDARLLINLVQTAAERGAVLLNYVKVTGLLKNAAGLVSGARAVDQETQTEFEVRARAVINATGPFTDSLRRMDEPSSPTLIAPSQGIHLVLDRSFLPSSSAIMVPETPDGRVMFALPWHNHTLVGTTDTPIPKPSLDPRPMDGEVDFVLSTARRYLSREPSRSDVLSAFAGIRPLVRAGDGKSTSELSRDHTIFISKSGLCTIVGGKWTTYRNMAEDCVNQAAVMAELPERDCVTRKLKIHGHHEHAQSFGELWMYGSDAPEVKRLIESKPEYAMRLHPALPYRAGEVVWATRNEYARTIDDYLSRRARATFLNAQAALSMAPTVAQLMAEELGQDATWIQEQLSNYRSIAHNYLLDP